MLTPILTLSFRRLYSHRCLGVAVFYNTRHLEKTAEMRVFFPDHAQRLRENNGTKRKQSDVSDDDQKPDKRPSVGGSTGSLQRTNKAASGVDLPQRGDGGEVGTQGEGGTHVGIPAAPSRLEQDLSGRPDAAVMVRLRVRGQGKENNADGKAGGDETGEGKERSLTLVCAHLWFDPFRPDLKTAQCKLLFDAIGQFHDKCGVIPGSHEKAAVETGGMGPKKTGASGPANLIMCGDFNSVPVLNPVFLPGPLKVGEIECACFVLVRACEYKFLLCTAPNKWGALSIFLLRPPTACHQRGQVDDGFNYASLIPGGSYAILDET